MKFTEAKNPGSLKKSKLQKFVLDFQQAHIYCAEVTEFINKDAYSCASALNFSANRLGRPHIKAHVIDGKCYLFNTAIKGATNGN